jgi:HSP20 family protein
MQPVYRLTENRAPRYVWNVLRMGEGAQRPLRAPRAGFEPPTDVYETPDRLVVRMEIAGLRPEELEVSLSVDGQLLTISGRREDPGAGIPRKYYTLEIECGEFARQIPVRAAVERAAVSASYADGFLEVVLPKAAPPAPHSRRVPIE